MQVFKADDIIPLMPPEVIRYSEKPGQPEYFTVDLLSDKPFDPVLFDMQAKLLGTGPYTRLKYVVIDNMLFGFDFFTTYNQFYEDLKKSGNEDKLQSAGKITIDIADTGKRTITDYALTLAEFLSKEESDNYKTIVLKEKLGGYFDIELAPPTYL